MASTGYLFRNQPSPPQAYYSAWFYVPSTITVGAWLSLTHFSGSETGDGKNLAAIWDVNLYPLPGGGVAAQLYDYTPPGSNLRQTTPVPFPLDAWVQLEVYLSKATGPTGEVTVWQDGVQILQRLNVATVSNDWVQWDAGALRTPVRFRLPHSSTWTMPRSVWPPLGQVPDAEDPRRKTREVGRGADGLVRRVTPTK